MLQAPKAEEDGGNEERTGWRSHGTLYSASGRQSKGNFVQITGLPALFLSP